MMIQLYSLNDLCDAVREHKAVVAPNTVLSGPRPAAFVMNWSGFVIWNLIQKGLFIYEKGGKV